MAGILVVHNLEVETDIGECQIQLCVGDITSLPKEDEVDVLVLSAFPGDYSPTSGSLIGQLYRKLGVSVRMLAKDKEEDLRSLYSCWWSKPLSDNLSFKKILCFEGGFHQGSKHHGQVIGDVFRCLVPILANKEGKVIMPLLSTGDQGFSKKKMLKLLVNAAVHWMKAGLQLRCLKIVLFSSNVTKKDLTHEPLITLFKKLNETHKEKRENKKSSVTVETYDIYLSYSEEDKNYVIQVVDGLKQKRSDLRIFLTIQELDVEESWQEKLYNTITRSKRVMALLTPSYLSSARCTEQYNIALCHSRKVHQNMLVPLYISEVPFMPTYMKLTQYIDCRFDFAQKLSYACVTVVSSLTVSPNQTTAQSSQDSHISDEKVLSTADNYDVFLSYSHCNEDEAKKIMKALLIHNRNIDIFIDTAQLKAGAAWQQALYDALDCSKYVIALISNDYLLSKVCMEEFSLSLEIQQQNNSRVLPLIIEPLNENLEWLSLLSPVKCFEKHEKSKDHTITGVCKKIVNELEEQPGKPCITENEDLITPLVSVLEETRSLLFQSENHFSSLVVGAGHQNIPTSIICDKNESTSPDIYIISSSEDSEYCQLLHQLILSQNSSLVIKKFSDESSSVRLTFLDEARLIISLLSRSFTQSAELVHELNIAWCRQRTSLNLCFLAITVDHLPDKPTYIRLFPSFFNCLDRQWMDISANLKQHATPPTNVLNSCKCPRNALFCFMAAADEIKKWLEDGQQCCVFGLHNKFINYFHLNACVQQSKEIPSLKEEERTVVVESALEYEKEDETGVAIANTDLKSDSDKDTAPNSQPKIITCDEMKPPLNASNNEDKSCNEVNMNSNEVKPPQKASSNEDKSCNEVNTNSNEVKPPLKAPNNEDKSCNEVNTNSNEEKRSLQRINRGRTSTTCLIF